MSDASPGPEILALDITTPEGRIRGNLAVPPGEMRLAELAWNAMPLDEKLVGMAVRRATKDGAAEISCKKGCGACCRQVVPLSPPEAWMIADLVAGMPEPRKAGALARFAETGEALAASGVKQALLGRIETIDQMKAISLAYFKLGLACPFLEDESCSIHPYRPSICREYLVTSPADHCAELGRRPVARIPVSIRLSEALSRLTGRLLSVEPEVVPLPLALEWAAAHREEGQRRWEGRLLLEGLVEELGRPAGALE